MVQDLAKNLKYINVFITVCIGSNCPGISGTVPDLLTLSLVPEGLPICPGRSLISS